LFIANSFSPARLGPAQCTEPALSHLFRFAGPLLKCVQRLMQKMGLRALIRAKRRFRHVPGMSDVNVPNVLQRDFFAEAPNQKWVTDVTEFNVHGQKLYLSACMDLYNGEIIAHRMARRPVFDLVSDTLREALARSACASELVVHSDQGWHYKMQPYRAMLEHH